MTYRPDGDFLEDDESRWDVGPEEPDGGTWWKWAVAGLSLALFGGVIWYAYQSGSAGPIGPIRTVEADPTPYKSKPENPGGEIIPDQDKLVFNEAVGRTTDTEDILGDQPEQPLNKPASVPVRKFVPPPPKPTPPSQAAVEVAQPSAAAPQDPTVPPREDTPAKQAAGPADAPGAPRADSTKPVPVIVRQPPAPAAEAPEPQAAEAPKVAEAHPTGSKSPVVQLGAYGTEAGAMESWAEVQRKQGAIIGGLSPQVIRFSAPGKGELFRLVIGPFADRAAANDICAQLKANGRDCIVNAN